MSVLDGRDWPDAGPPNVIDIPQPVPDPPAELRCRIYLMTVEILRDGEIPDLAVPWKQTIPYFHPDDDTAIEHAQFLIGCLTRAYDIPMATTLRRGLVDTSSPGNVSLGPVLREWRNPRFKAEGRKSEGGVILPGE